jgi:anti-sigma factor RsiW
MCDEREPLLAYLYDEADSVERQRVEAHLATCERCREELAGLRGVRSDLLAWDVPDHESVWKPFTPARPTWSWRDVPSWSLAAAALVMLTLGAAGGLGASTWFAGRPTAPAPLVAAAPQPAPAVVGAAQAVTPADLAALEQRLRDAVSRRPAAMPVSTGFTSADYDQLIAISFEQQNALSRQATMMSNLEKRVTALQTTVNGLAQNAGQPGSR